MINVHLFIAPLITKSKLFAPLTQCVLTHNWKVVCCLSLSYGTKYSNMDQARFAGDSLSQNLKAYGLLEADQTPSNFLKAIFYKFYSVHSAKNSKLNETRICAQSCQSGYIFSLDLALEQALSNVKNLPFWNTTDFTYYMSHIIAKKTCHFFFMLKSSITQFSIDFTTSESLFSYLVLRKEFTIFLFLSAMSEKQERATCESLKDQFTESQKVKKLFPSWISLWKQFNL